jgi:hypothetical protein
MCLRFLKIQSSNFWTAPRARARACVCVCVCEVHQSLISLFYTRNFDAEYQISVTVLANFK